MFKEQLSSKEIELIRICQGNIPLCENLFGELARQLQVKEEWIYNTLQNWKDKNILRRFKAILYHRNAGFNANGMSVWAVPESRTEEAGRKLASFSEVSHCYLRPQLPGWPYNIYGMLHGKNKYDVEQCASKISIELGISDYQILYSEKEFKKSSMKYFVPEIED